MYLIQITRPRPEVAAAILVLTLLPLYYASYRYRHSHPYRTLDQAPLSRDGFIDAWLDTHVIAPFTPSAVGQYCNSSTWHPKLIFDLNNANGGIGNVRGNIFDFVFSAIEAGASIFLPGMASRDAWNLSILGSEKANFDKFFDNDWFIQSLRQACPQMTVYTPLGDQSIVRVVPENYNTRTRRTDTDLGNNKKKAVEQFKTWLGEKQEYSENEFTVVNIERTLWDVDTRNLPRGFRRNFAQILRINPAIRQIAATIVHRLSEQYGLAIDPSVAIPQRAFYGAHLRTEADAANAGWLDAPNANFSSQTNAYITHALKNKLRVMYIASGNTSELARFKEKAATYRFPIEVTSKFDLLSGEESAALQSLTWDQQALVDYEVLQRCSVFGGLVKSSFSYNIAMTRNQWLTDHARRSEPWFVQHSEHGVSFDDGLSRIIGRDEWHEKRIPRGMWP